MNIFTSSNLLLHLDFDYETRKYHLCDLFQLLIGRENPKLIQRSVLSMELEVPTTRPHNSIWQKIIAIS